MELKVPFNVYDLFGILFPGTLVLFLATLVYEPLGSYIAGASSWESVPLLVVLAYVAGEVAAGLSKYTVGILRDRADGWEDLSTTERGQLEAGLRAHYALELSVEEFRKARFDLASSLVPDRMPNYLIFLARSDLNRSLSLLCWATTIVGWAGVFGLPLSVQLSRLALITLGALSGLLGGLLFLRSRYFYRLARRVIYYAALQYFAEGKLGARKNASTNSAST